VVEDQETELDLASIESEAFEKLARKRLVTKERVRVLEKRIALVSADVAAAKDAVKRAEDDRHAANRRRQGLPPVPTAAHRQRAGFSQF
jgi:hypothetical protein